MQRADVGEARGGVDDHLKGIFEQLATDRRGGTPVLPHRALEHGSPGTSTQVSGQGVDRAKCAGSCSGPAQAQGGVVLCDREAQPEERVGP